jgi:RNA polymerase sigma-70 factor, ECF subfamily
MSKTSKPPTTSAAKADDSTKDLVLRAKVGDRSAENEIVRRSLPRLRRFAHGRLPPAVRNGSDTEDIVQESLLQTLQRLPGFDPARPGGLQAYLRVALQNKVKDAVRRRARFSSLGDVAEPVDRRPSPYDAVKEKELVARQEAVLNQLRPSDRALLVARIELGYDYAQIARLFGKPSADAARVAVHRALRRAVDAAK